jgi:hypothetical protein
MKQKSFEQLLKEEIRVDRLTPLQFSGILRAHAKYEIQSEQLRKHSVVRGGDKEKQSIPRAVDYVEFMKEQYTPNTPTEPLATEARDTVAEARVIIEECKKRTNCGCVGECKLSYEDARKSSEGQP